MRSWLGGMPSAGRAVKWIALANIGLFLLCQLTGQARSPLYHLLTMETTLVLEGQVWRLFTFTYLHDQHGLWHIFLNMLGLYFLGAPLERHWGGKRFFAFYTVGGFVAVCLYFALTAAGWLPQEDVFGRPIVLVGASGGVLAVLGACAVLFPQFRIIMIIFPVPIRTAALILVVLYSFNLWNKGGNAGGDACHLAGLAFGIAWGYRGHLWTRQWDHWRDNLKRGAWEAKRRDLQATEEDVDRILDKVQREGISSLTHREKHKLETATKTHREADRRHRL
jgi:membrane associated rhomboid family serine protease